MSNTDALIAAMTQEILDLKKQRDQWRDVARKLAKRVHHVVDDNDGMPDYDADWKALADFDRLNKEMP